MRFILRDAATGLYATGVGGWTQRAEEAFDFRSGARAIHFALEGHLKNVELVFAFDDPAYNIHVPLGDQPGVRPGFDFQPPSGGGTGPAP